MIELGKYGGAILGSYGITIGLLLVLLAFSWIKGRRIAKQLSEIEQRRTQTDGKP